MEMGEGRGAKEALCLMLRAALEEQEMPKALIRAEKNVVAFSTAAPGAARGRAALGELLREEFPPGQGPLRLSFEELEENASQDGANVHGLMAAADIHGAVSRYRLTAGLCFGGEGPLVCLLHLSLVEEEETSAQLDPVSLRRLKRAVRADMHRLLVQAASGGMLAYYREEGLPLYFINDQMLVSLGYTYEQFMEETGGRTLRCVHPDDRALLTRAREDASPDGEFQLSYRMLRRDGGVIWVRDCAKHVQVGQGCKAVLSVRVDITETMTVHSLLEEKARSLAARNRELAALTASVPGGVCEIVPDEGITLRYGNEGFYAIVGYTPEELAREQSGGLAGLLRQEDCRVFRETVSASLERGQSLVSMECSLRRRDGSLVWVLLRGNFLREQTAPALSCVIVDISERKEIEQELRINEQRFRIALAQTENTIFDYDLRTKVMIHGEKSAETYGLMKRTENVPDSLVQVGVVHPDCVGPFLEMYQMIRAGVPTADCVIRVRLAEGAYVWRRISMTAIFDEAHRPVRAVGILEDVSKQKEMEAAYLREEQYRAAMMSEAVAMVEMDLSQNKILRADKGWAAWYGGLRTDCYDDALAYSADSVRPEDRAAYCAAFLRENLLESFRQGATEFRLEYRVEEADGNPRWMLGTTHLVADPATNAVKGFTYVRDIDRQKREESCLRYQSERDALTGLYNKGMTEKRIRELLADDQRGSAHHALFVLDIDAFKDINDHFGHRAGDQALAATARRLDALFRESDILGRIGGDEFIVFLRSMGDSRHAEEKARELCLACRQPFREISGEVQTSCSVGVALFPQDGCTFEELYQNADIALYEAKKQGKDGFAIFHEAMRGSKWIPYSSSAIDQGSPDGAREKL